MKFKSIEIRNRKRFREYIYVDGDYIGKIVKDFEGDYLFKPSWFATRYKLGKGKCLKEISERLIELNYK